MKKFFKKLNIARSPLFRIICVLCAVATCVLPFAVSASAAEYETISIWDLPYTVSVDGDTNNVTVEFLNTDSPCVSLTENRYILGKNDYVLGTLNEQGDPATEYAFRCYTKGKIELPNDAVVSVTCSSGYRWICYFFDEAGVYIGKTGFRTDSVLDISNVSLSEGTIEGAKFFRICIAPNGSNVDLTGRIQELVDNVVVKFNSIPGVQRSGVTSYYPDTMGIGFLPESNTSYRINFFPLGFNDRFIDGRDFPSGTVVSFEGQVQQSSPDYPFADLVSSNGVIWAVGYKSYNQNLVLTSEKNSNAASSTVDNITYFAGKLPVEFAADSSLISFEFYVYFDTLSVPDDINNSLYFSYEKLHLTFSIASLWLEATQNNRLNGVLDEVKTELKEQGTTLNQVLKEQGITNDKLDDVLGEQEETNDKLDNIINGTVDSTLPPDSGTVDEFHKQEEEIMGSVNEGFDTALGVLEDTLISIMEMLAGFHAIAYIFNLFYSLPLIQLVVNFSLVLGLFGAMLGVANFVGNKFIGKVGGKGKD
ncbi:MAG: hypothetical protein E7433_01205 [Ruminococcaceae bacterium]|nr:hypothetical protein [Oscillospiraceae bacterium]